MRYSAFCILLLTISEPLLAHANKVVLVIPQQTRRSMVPVHGPSWRSVSPRYRKSSNGGETHYHRYHGPPSHYHSKKPMYSNTPFPHGGDDFDQGYEHVNHVHIPYGKGIHHAVTYGKGYVPYDQIKGSFSFGHERNPTPKEHKQPEPAYSTTSFTTTSSDYTPSGQSYESTQPETYFTNPESALNYNERRHDQKKYYSSRSIEDLIANNPIDFGATANKDQLFLLQQKATELYNNVIPQPQSGVVLPSSVPSATIGGSKEGIVLRDTVALDEYQQKLQEMTKSWPQFLANPAGSLSNNFQNHQVSASYTTGVSPSSSFSGSISWPLSFAQQKQSYDVKEDTMEPPHDFRTMPIQTSPFHSFSVPVNVAAPGIAQAVHG